MKDRKELEKLSLLKGIWYFIMILPSEMLEKNILSGLLYIVVVLPLILISLIGLFFNNIYTGIKNMRIRYKLWSANRYCKKHFGDNFQETMENIYLGRRK